MTLSSDLVALLRRTPEPVGVVVTARDAERGSLIRIKIIRSARGGDIARPASPNPSVTMREWSHPDDIYHTIDAEEISDAEITEQIKHASDDLSAIWHKMIRDDDANETRWQIKLEPPR